MSIILRYYKLLLLLGTFYSTEGSTLAIKAMLALIKKSAPVGKRTKVLAARNVHKAFIYACALLDIDAEWIYPARFTHLCECIITPCELKTKLASLDSLPDAVYITSPDYLGNIADIKGLSKVCREHRIPLLVDNAHGAYLAFCEPSMHPLALGAAMCCDSAHKTLPVLTGGAYLHVSKDFGISEQEVRSALSLFASTSPSYLIMQSLDLCNAYLDGDFRTELAECIRELDAIKAELCARGIETEPSEPLKLVFNSARCGYFGDELARLMKGAEIEPEFSDADTLVLMFSPSLRREDISKLTALLNTLKPRKRANLPSLPVPDEPVRAKSIRDAIFCPSHTVSLDEAIGKVCASPTVSCPPAVPVVMSGEVISERSIALMRHYGIEKIDVCS